MNTQMPIGVDDFKEVRENYYFVDKTHFIQSLIDGRSKNLTPNIKMGLHTMAYAFV